MKADRHSGAPSEGAASGKGPLDEGRKYWKAAIAHLAPEKREAAWEFYLDRLESSAAADTLGGVMLVLEADLAFFDDLPARLGAAAQQFESALKVAGNGVSGGATPSKIGTASSSNSGLPSAAWKVPAWIVAVVLAVAGASFAAILMFLHKESQPDSSSHAPPSTVHILSLPAHAISVEPWYDASARRQRGCIVLLPRAAWSECTQTGGAKVYVLSPAEEVRRDLESLRQAAPSSAPKVP